MSTSGPVLLPWNAEGLWEQLEPWLPGLSVEILPRCDSTNSVLLERARAEHRALHAHEGNPDAPDLALVRRSRESAAFSRRPAELPPCLLVAEHQQAGRGRLGRSWASAPSGASLTFSLALPLPGDLAGLSLAVGLSLAEALEPQPASAPHPRLQLKWPNDLWLCDAPSAEDAPPSGRKLGGVLIETVSLGATRQVVIGVGLNIEPQPLEIDAGALAHGYACVKELDPALDAPTTLQRVMPLLVRDLIAFQRSGFKPCVAAFERRDFLRGHLVRTTQSDMPEGVAEGVADNGALRVRSADGRLGTIHSGEVSVRLAPDSLAPHPDQNRRS